MEVSVAVLLLVSGARHWLPSGMIIKPSENSAVCGISSDLPDMALSDGEYVSDGGCAIRSGTV